MILCSLLFITVIGGAHLDHPPAPCTKFCNQECPTGRPMDRSCRFSVPRKLQHYRWTIDLNGVHNIFSISISICDKGKYTSDLSGIQIHIGNEDDSTTGPIYANNITFEQNRLNNLKFYTSVSGRYVSISTHKRGNLVLCEVMICSTKKDSPFKLIKEKMKWADALYYCRDRHMDLASILDQEAQVWAELEAQTADTPFVWLGLRYTCTLGFWFWVEDHVLQFSHWSPKNKKEECDMSVAMETKGDHLWFSKSDDEMFNFICAK